MEKMIDIIMISTLLLETMPPKGPISLSVQNKVIAFTSTKHTLVLGEGGQARVYVWRAPDHQAQTLTTTPPCSPKPPCYPSKYN